jgi:cell division protein FtsB
MSNHSLLKISAWWGKAADEPKVGTSRRDVRPNKWTHEAMCPYQRFSSRGLAFARLRPDELSPHRKLQKYTTTHSPIAFACRACLTCLVNVDLGIWSKLTKVVVALVVTAFVLLIGMCYVPPIQQNERMRVDILRLQTELQKQEEISKQLKAEIDAIRNDPKALERLTREKLGYARPTETVIRFEQPRTNTTVR